MTVATTGQLSAAVPIPKSSPTLTTQLEQDPILEEIIVKKTLTLLSLVAFLCLSLTAFAASKNGIVTSNGGRVTTATHGASMSIGSGFQPDAGLSAIYNNFSNYPLGMYWCCQGWTISGPNSLIGATYADAMPFTPATNATATEIAVGVGYVTGTNGVTVSLNADSGNLPGSVIAHFDGAGLPAFGSCCAVIFKSSSKGVALSAGTQYWVVVQTSNNTADTWDAWNDNDTNQTAQPFAFSNNGVWGNTSGILGAFAVLGH